MGYQHVENLYKNPDIFLFREVWALEKIHGSSAHVRYRKGEPLHFFSGGEKASTFVAIFDPALLEKFVALGHEVLCVYGEAYGGKCQGMGHVYGPALRFVAFDVLVGDTWANVPAAEEIVKSLGLEFVHHEKAQATPEALNALRDADSVQAKRNGFPFPGSPESRPVREGIVVKPLIELARNDGKRIMAKHKSELFRETSNPRSLDVAELNVISDARAVAEEWVTPMRLEHVLQKVVAPDVSHTGTVVKAMIADVRREAEGEVVWSREVEKAIGARTAQLFKRKMTAA